jgi:hypothetical protein
MLRLPVLAAGALTVGLLTCVPAVAEAAGGCSIAPLSAPFWKVVDARGTNIRTVSVSTQSFRCEQQRRLRNELAFVFVHPDGRETVQRLETQFISVSARKTVRRAGGGVSCNGFDEDVSDATTVYARMRLATPKNHTVAVRRSKHVSYSQLCPSEARKSS